MVDMSRKTYERNGIERITDGDKVLWLNCHTEGLDHKNLWMTTVKYLLRHRKYRHELVDEPKKTTQQNFYTQRISN